MPCPLFLSTWLFSVKMGDNPASYSTQSEGELLECSPAAGPGSQASPEAKGAVPGAVGGPGGKRNGKTPSGKLKRKLKRLKNEPKSVVGELGCL